MRLPVSNILKLHHRHSLVLFRRLTASDQAQNPAGSGNSNQQQQQQQLKQDVINLYKNLLYLSREWPSDLRPQIKNAFMKNRHVNDPNEIRKLIARGEYVSREITATYHLRKYRAMKRRYYSDDREKQMDEMFKSLGGQ